MLEKELVDGKRIWIREVQMCDAKPLMEYRNHIAKESTFTTFSEGEWEPSLEEEQNSILAFQKGKNSHFLVAISGEEIVGSLALSGKDRIRIRHYAELGISVRKPFWGLGIGEALIQSAHQIAKEGGILKKIELRVTAHNHRAVKLYKKCGYVQEGYTTRDMFVDGEYFDSYVMGCWIG